MINLDYLCAKTGQEIGGETDRSILQKALGVLHEDGVYAMFLWLEEKETKKEKEKEKEKEKKVRKKLTCMLNEDKIRNHLFSDSSTFSEDFKEFCARLIEVAKDIDKLFFLKMMLERTLTYALYHAKIKEPENVEKN